MVGLKRDGRESVGHKATLWGLFVAPECQRRGIGRSLLEETIKEARKLGLRYLRLITATSSDSAMGLFRSIGFKQYGLEEASICDGERYFDHAYMALSLSA